MATPQITRPEKKKQPPGAPPPPRVDGPPIADGPAVLAALRRRGELFILKKGVKP